MNTITLASTWRTSTIWMPTTATSSGLHSWEERHLCLHRSLPSRHLSPPSALHDKRLLLTVFHTPRVMCTHSRGLRESDVAVVVRCVCIYVMTSLCLL